MPSAVNVTMTNTRDTKPEEPNGLITTVYRKFSTATPVAPRNRPSDKSPLYIHNVSTSDAKDSASCAVSFIGRLPTELRILIMEWVARDFESRRLTSGLGALACINSEWQEIIEPYVFKNLSIGLYNIRLLENLNSRRKRLIRTLRINVRLPEYKKTQLRLEEETIEERQQNAATYALTVRRIMEVLSMWHESEVYAKGITLELTASSLSDFGGRSFNDKFLSTWRFAESILCLPEEIQMGGLPNVYVISAFKTTPTTRRTISAQSITTIISKLRSCKVVDIDIDRKPRALYTESDFDLRLRQWPPTIDKVVIVGQTLNVSRRQVPLEGADRTWQPRKIGSFYELLGRIKHIRLHNIIDASSFFQVLWPRTEDFNSVDTVFSQDISLGCPLPLYPMESFEFIYSSLNYPQDWRPSPYTGSQDARLTLWREKISLAAARLALFMPNIKSIKVGQRTMMYAGKHTLEYEVTARGDSKFMGKAVLRWRSTFDFQPRSTIIQAWAHVAKKNARANLEVEIIKLDNWAVDGDPDMPII